MGEPGFWDDQATAAKVSAEHARTSRKLESFAALQADVDDLEGLVELAEEDPDVAAEVDGAVRLRGAAARRAGGGAPLLRPVRRGRRARHGQRRRRRDRRPGLGRDGAAHDDALGREPRLRGRAAGGERRGGGRASSRPPSARRARTPTACSAPRRACTGWCASRRSTRRAPPDRVRGRRGRARDRGPGRRRDRRRRPADRHLPRLGRRRPARQQDRLGRADHAPPDGHRRPVPERALAVGQQGHRDEDAALASSSSSASASAARRSRARRARRRTSTSARRSAPTSCTRTRWSRITGPTTKWATSRRY